MPTVVCCNHAVPSMTMCFLCGLTAGHNDYYFGRVVLLDQGKPVMVSPSVEPLSCSTLINSACGYIGDSRESSAPTYNSFSFHGLLITPLLHQSCVKPPLMKAIHFPTDAASHEKGPIILILRFMLVFWDSTRTCFHASMLKKTHTAFTSYCLCWNNCIHLLSETVFRTCLSQKSPVISDWSVFPDLWHPLLKIIIKGL